MRKKLANYPVRLILWGLLPVLLYGAILAFYVTDFMGYVKEMVDLSLTWFLLYGIGFLLPVRFVKRLWFLVVLSLFSFIVFFKLSFYYLYESKITLSAFYIMFETNAMETKEFLTLYFNWAIGFFFLVICFALFKQLQLLFSQKQKDYDLPLYSNRSYTNLFLGLFLLGGIVLSIYIIKKKTQAFNIYYAAVGAYYSYEEMQEVFKSHLAKPESEHFTGVKSEDIPQTYVLVIGESTTSKNMSLYGYYRKTNPLLEEIKEELVVFDEVIAPHAHTIPSLNKALTLSNYEKPDALELGSSIQLANAAGFETYWISNQQPIGLYENMVTLLSKACNQQIFLSEENHQYGAYDERVLAPLEKALAQPAEKKFIIIHLMGTHSVYKHRYPKDYEVFKDAPKTKFPSASATMMINEYDNAILYNDYVVREIIESVKAENLNSFVLFLSDHGDEVFHDMDLVGHNEYYGTDAMFEVPFVLWMSEDFKKFQPRAASLENYAIRKYLMDDLMHSLFDLGRIQFDLLETERSIFHPDFKPRKRIVKKDIDYDAR